MAIMLMMMLLLLMMVMMTIETAGRAGAAGTTRPVRRLALLQYLCDICIFMLYLYDVLFVKQAKVWSKEDSRKKMQQSLIKSSSSNDMTVANDTYPIFDILTQIL